jgi:glutathione S-transferase
MALTLYFHPFASFCQKVLVALYENATPFTAHRVDLADAASRKQFLKVWPIGKFPVLHDDARNLTIPESSIIIEYLARHYPGAVALIPADPDLALQARLEDRFYDLYVNEPMAKIVTNRLRPSGHGDAFGAEHARGALRTAYDLIEEKMASRPWAVGEPFSMADCAAAPALFYANLVQPFGASHTHTAAYLERLRQRPSFARVIDEARPYFAMFPT